MVNAEMAGPGGLDQNAAALADVHRAGVFDRVIDKLMSAMSHLCALILIFEIGILLAAVIFRYGFHQPLSWSDEVAELLLIWLAMLGSVVGVHTGQHLRLMIFVDLLPPRPKAVAEAACLALSAIVCALLAVFALQDVRMNYDLMSPVLEISPAWKMGALVIGLALTAVLFAQQFVHRATSIPRIATTIIVATLMGAMGLAFMGKGAFLGLGNLNLLIFFLGVGGACLALSVPIALCFAIAATCYVLFGTTASLEVVPARMETGMAHILLLSAPLFIVLGSALVISGMANKLVRLLVALIGHVRGGLSYALVGAIALVSGISGSKAADMAAIAPILVPEMRKRGSSDGEIVGLLAAACAMSETIPPSLILIMTGAVTGVSIGALFAEGWYPALAIAALLCVLAYFRSGAERGQEPGRAAWLEVRRLALIALPVLALPFLIRSVVVEGVATATEVATIGVVYILIVTLLIERRFDWRRFYSSLRDAAVLTGVVFLILATANAMAWGFVQSNFSATLSALAAQIPGGAYGFLVAAILAFVLLGSILEGIPAIVLLGPLLFPVARTFGISDVHFALVAVLAMGVGLFAPPVGVGFYTACAICRVDPGVVLRAIWPYLGIVVLGIVLVAFGPVFARQLGIH